MEKELVDKKLGEEGHIDIDIKGTTCCLDISYLGSQAKAGMYVHVDIIAILEAAALKTDNKVDDGFVAAARQLFEAM